jgi:hypothetical protein
MHPALRQAYERELAAAAERYSGHDLEQAFFHLERAHILGQAFTLPHAKAHWWMLKVGWRRRDLIEITGQVARIVGATLFTWIWIPVGNTGGVHVPPFKSMPIPEEFQELLNPSYSSTRLTNGRPDGPTG